MAHMLLKDRKAAGGVYCTSEVKLRHVIHQGNIIIVAFDSFFNFPSH